MPNILMLAPTAKSFLGRNMHENPTFRSPNSLTCQYQREVPLPLHLGAKAAFPVVPVKLFQLVVQVSHKCTFHIWLVFLITLRS